MRALVLAAFASLSPAAASAAGLLTAQGVEVLDSVGAQRTTFSSNERITMSQRVSNAVASSQHIRFTFLILNPSGSQAFRHTGNAVPGSVGSSASRVSGVPISGFYSGPGTYTLKARAVLDGQTIEQEKTFAISSPNILLIYPPNGARGLTDRPLTLRWSSSGAARYRVTVGESPSFYNSVFSQTTAGGESFLTYPDNPSDQRQRLSSGQVYYWKVEGLDASGNVVAQSPVPFNFSVESAALTRDLAVTLLEVSGRPSKDSLSFRMKVENQGGTSETGVSFKFSLGGLPAPGTPVALPLLKPGDAREYSFTAVLPPDQGQSLAIACVEFFDDNVPNNCKTVQISRSALEDQDGEIPGGSPPLTKEQIWEAIKELLRARGIDLDEYRIIGISEDLSREELEALLAALRAGQVQISLTGPPTEAAPPPDAPPPDASGSPAASARAEEEDVLGKEWSGYCPPAAEELRTLKIEGAREFRRLWRRLGREEERPEIDFKQFMVVGIMAGSADRADRAEIADIVTDLSGVRVVYRLVVRDRLVTPLGSRRAELRSSVPYHLRVIQKTGKNVEFVRERRKRGVGGRKE